MTLVTSGSEEIIEQITKQLNKLVEVVKLLDLTEGAHIEREMMMIKVKAEKGQREEIKRLVDIFRGNIIDVTDTSYIIEMTGDSEKLDAFVSAVHEDLVVEVVRTGPSGIGRGAKGLTL
jgi:acetolactate synthase-1/3 small subunit